MSAFDGEGFEEFKKEFGKLLGSGAELPDLPDVEPPSESEPMGHGGGAQGAPAAPSDDRMVQVSATDYSDLSGDETMRLVLERMDRIVELLETIAPEG